MRQGSGVIRLPVENQSWWTVSVWKDEWRRDLVLGRGCRLDLSLAPGPRMNLTP